MKHLSLVRLSTLGLTLCAIQVQAAPATESVAAPRVMVDGQYVKFPDTQPRFMYNHVMVPMRGVFEKLHANVDWNGGMHQITCVNDRATVKLILGDNEARVNGEKIIFDAPATLSHGRTLVPLQFLAQSLGARVQWDNATQTVHVLSPKYSREHGL
jgi:hypothetical protein